MKDVSNTKKAILFKAIMQEITLSRTREDGGNSNNQHKDNKFFDNQFNRNQQSDKARHFNKFEKNDKSDNYFNTPTANKRTHAKMKNEKNKCCFECHKSEHYHRNCSEKNKWSKATMIRMITLDSKNDGAPQAPQQRNKKNQ